MKNNPLFKLAIAAVALLDIVLSASSRGQNVTATFTNGFGDGIWERNAHIGVIGNPNDPPIPGNWSTGAYPNNSNHITDPNTGMNIPGDNPFYDVVIDIPGCTLGASVSVQTVTIATSSTLNLAPTSLLAIANGQLTNNGAILVNTTGAGYTTKIRFDADATLGGNGSVTLNGIGTSADLDILNSFTVTHAANHIIRGKGTNHGDGVA